MLETRVLRYLLSIVEMTLYNYFSITQISFWEQTAHYFYVSKA